MKMCPVLTLMNKQETSCIGHKCAWYSQNVGECCLRAIATILKSK